jgi:hypothetical protein
MTTQASNVLDQDMIDSLRRELHGNVFTNAANQLTSTFDDAVEFVTSPVQDMVYDSNIKTFVMGTLFGVVLTFIVRIAA